LVHFSVSGGFQKKSDIVRKWRSLFEFEWAAGVLRLAPMHNARRLYAFRATAAPFAVGMVRGEVLAIATHHQLSSLQ
jgi:hypothetical protein